MAKRYSCRLDTGCAHAEFTGDIAARLRRCLRLGNPAIDGILRRIGKEVLEPGFASGLLVEGLGLTLLVETYRLLGLQSEKDLKGGLPPWRLKRIEERLRTGASSPSLTELSALCGLSGRQLSRAFRQETGYTLSAYIQAMLIQRAKELLAADQMSVSEIAFTLGFAAPSSFATAFRRTAGVSPRDYKSLHKSTVRQSERPPRLVSH